MEGKGLLFFFDRGSNEKLGFFLVRPVVKFSDVEPPKGIVECEQKWR